MTLQALYHYYEILMDSPDLDVAQPGYSSANINFALNLSKQGDLLDIFPFTTLVQQGKKTREIPSRRMIVPEQVIRSSGVSANFMWDNASYVLGISDKDEDNPLYSLQRFEAFREFNVTLLSTSSGEVAQAVVSFLQHHDPAMARNNTLISRHLEGLQKGANLVFQVEGQNAHDDPQIKHTWEEFRSGTQAEVMQCLVTGSHEPIARLHPKIKGVRDGQSIGSTLVGFNDRAYESYNRTNGQGLNSPVSQRVASGYGVALNYLLSAQNPNRKIYIGDATVVYWAESSDPRYANTFIALLNPDFIQEQPADPHLAFKEGEEILGQVAKKVQQGLPLDATLLQENLDETTRFFVLGLSPNVARISVRFFLTDAFGKFIERTLKHYEDLRIVKEFPDQPDTISIYKIMRECIPPKVSKPEEVLKSITSLIGGALLRSILLGAPYPESLYSTIINRVRVDGDDKDRHTKKINYVRVAVIKACLLRKYSHQAHNPFKEALQVMLNQEFTHPAYVLGRLFAVLEKAQGEAIGNANATIKDRYFASACATPRSIFPILLKLSQHHTAKAEYGHATDRRIEQLLNLLDGGTQAIPSRLTLDEQGVFILGYYHQRAAFYTRNSGKDDYPTLAETEE